MDFVSCTVIIEIDNWYGALFEIILDSYCKEDTLDNPNYLDF